MRLRVFTFNVRNQEGDPRRADLINRELHRLDPDLIALQEVVHTPEHLQLDRLRGMDLHSTHQAQVMATVPPGGERYGSSAVATRWPHRVVEVLDLRVSDAKDVPWGTLAVSVSLADEGDLLFIGATAAWRLDAEAARERQVIALTDLDTRHRDELPTIIAGDFNATPDAASIRYLTGRQSLGGRFVHYHDTWTIDNANARSVIDQVVRQPNHRRRVDYVFIGSWHAHPSAHCHVRAATLAFDRPTDGVWPSDHFGVVVDLEIGRRS